MTKYVALFRGINSGKNPPIKMIELKEVFVDLGFHNVKTVIASGNVVFETDRKDREELIKDIEEQFFKAFKFNSAVILRTDKEIEKLLSLPELGKIVEAPDLRTFVSFLRDKTSAEIPAGEGYWIIKNTGLEIVYTLSVTVKTVNIMTLLDKQFDKEVTTRSLKTVKRLL